MTLLFVFYLPINTKKEEISNGPGGVQDDIGLTGQIPISGKECCKNK